MITGSRPEHPFAPVIGINGCVGHLIWTARVFSPLTRMTRKSVPIPPWTRPRLHSLVDALASLS
jgi:hypothetical protein